MKAFARSPGAVLALLVILAPAPSAARRQGMAVGRVTITANGARSLDVSGDETPAFCRAFRLVPADVRTFFAVAGRVDERAFTHDLSMSRCHAAGTLTLKTGARARWFIDLERRGSLVLPGGRTLYFYCLACRSSKFDDVYEDDRALAKALWRGPPKRP
ncbi:hypothetical protein [Sphingomonas sp.]|uniref:hypothetical protein n=1 Tax=Sphingomonas sp. TaxID=28214 RepID=UPI003B3AAF57